MMRLTDDLILPFNLTSYAQSIQADFEALETTYGEQLANNSISLGKMNYIKFLDIYLK